MNILYKQFRFRLLITMLIITITSLTISFFVVYRVIARSIEDANENNTLEAFARTEASIDWVLDSARHLSTEILLDDTLQAYLNSEYRNIREKRRMEFDLAQSIDSFLNRNNILNAVILFRNDGQIAGSSVPRRYFSFNPQHPFYQSQSYSFAVENPFASRWITTDLRYFYSQSIPFVTLTERDIIIGLQRNIPGRTGLDAYHPANILIVSINESVLRYFYEQTAAEGTGIYLLDEFGRFFSGMDMNEFGLIPEFYEFIENDHGSFTWQNDESYRIIYYKMKSTDWYLVKVIPFSIYQQELQSVMTGMVTVTIFILILLTVAVLAPVLRLTKPIEELIFKMHNIEKEKTKLEIESLQNQLKPHFVYNTVTAIRWMANFHGADEVENSLLTFTKFLRPIFDSNTLLWSIDEEIKFIRDYCDLMRMRYGKNVDLEINIDTDVILPRFILQPFVENCFEHALTGREHLLITITVSSENNGIIELTIKDDGVGIPKERLDEINMLISGDGSETLDSEKQPGHSSIGIINSCRRLKLVFGPQFKCCIKQQEHPLTGIIVLLECPVNNDLQP